MAKMRADSSDRIEKRHRKAVRIGWQRDQEAACAKKIEELQAYTDGLEIPIKTLNAIFRDTPSREEVEWNGKMYIRRYVPGIKSQDNQVQKWLSWWDLKTLPLETWSNHNI